MPNLTVTLENIDRTLQAVGTVLTHITSAPAQGMGAPQPAGVQGPSGTNLSDYSNQIRQLQSLEQAFGQGQSGARGLRQEFEQLSNQLRSGSQNAAAFVSNFAGDRLGNLRSFRDELAGVGEEASSLTDLLAPGGLSYALGRNGVGAAFLIAADAARTYNDAVSDEATRVALQTTTQDVVGLTGAIAQLKDAQSSELEGYDRRIAALQKNNDLMARRQTLANMDADIARDQALAVDVYSSAGQAAGQRLPDELAARDAAKQRFDYQDQLDALQADRATARETSAAKINTQQDAINAARAAATVPGATPQTIQQSIDNALYPTGRPLNPPPGYPQAPYIPPTRIAPADPLGVTTRDTAQGIIGPAIDLNRVLGQFEYEHGLASRDAQSGNYTFTLPGDPNAGKATPQVTIPPNTPQPEIGKAWLEANNPFNAIPNAWNHIMDIDGQPQPQSAVSPWANADNPFNAIPNAGDRGSNWFGPAGQGAPSSLYNAGGDSHHYIHITGDNRPETIIDMGKGTVHPEAVGLLADALQKYLGGR